MKKGYIILVLSALLIIIVNCSRDEDRFTGPSGNLSSSEILLPVKEINSMPPIACWNFNEGNGSLAIDQCNEHDGDVIGATWMAGKCGSALGFDGENDYVTILGGSWLTQTKGTIEAWVKIHPDGTGGRIISTETGGWHNGLYLNWGTQLSNNDYINGGIFGGIHSTEGSHHYVETFIDNVSKHVWHFVAIALSANMNETLTP